MTKSKIEWTDETWNPIVGCSIVSPGCTNCYAMRTAHRMDANPKTPQYHGLTKMVNGNPVWTGAVRLHEPALLKPLSWKKPRMIFVNSMGDLFHEHVPFEDIDRVFAIMALCPQHTFQVLTKRADLMQAYIERLERIAFEQDLGSAVDYLLSTSISDSTWPRARETYADWPLKNVWLGVSTEDQKRANERIPHLLLTPAAFRFVSAEPLLGSIRFDDLCDGWKFMDAIKGTWWHDAPNGGAIQSGRDKIDWIIVGGESGPNARPMHPDWVRSIRDQCVEAGTAFFFKQ